MLLEEFDPSQTAIINPSDIVKPVEGMPSIAVTCFARSTFARMVELVGGEEIASASTANLRIPIYKAAYKGVEMALFMSDVGAPACVGLLEDVYEMGMETIVLFGTCGVLDKSIGDCSVIIPTSALRDEGTSYHYAPPGDEIPVNPQYTELFEELLNDLRCSYTKGKTWTTDAIYRETREKMLRRREQGCVCVDMESSAVAALARFRGKELFQFFYAADNLDGEQWDKRSLGDSASLTEKDKIALLALELALRIQKTKM